VRKSSPSRSSTTTTATRFMLKCLMRWRKCSEGAERPSPFVCCDWVGDVLSGGDTSSFLWESCENWCPSVSKGYATRSCEPP
jgi:hypothetical protein